MKIGGIDPRHLKAEYDLVLPRGDSFIVFKAIGLPNMDEFQKFCPEPKPPGKMTKDGWAPNPDDKNYQSVLEEYNKRRLAYIVVKSLEPSDIEWDTVNLNHPGTWAHWENDLKNAGLTQIECNRVVALVLEANSLDEAKLRQARDVFRQGLLQASQESGGQNTEPVSTPSGEPVSV
jgi:hypothetical protein